MSMDNQADWLDAVLIKVRFYPDVNFKPLGKYPHTIEEYHDKILKKAKAAITTKIAEELIAELEQLHRTNGKDLPKRDYDNVTDEEICERIDELKAALKGGK